MVDLRFNSFSKIDLEKFLDNLKLNKSLFAVDMRENDGYTE